MRRIILTICVFLLFVTGCDNLSELAAAPTLIPTATYTPAPEPTAQPTTTPSNIRLYCETQPIVMVGQPVEFVISADVPPETGINTVQFVMDYDNAALQYEGMTMGEMFDVEAFSRVVEEGNTGEKYLAYTAGRYGANGPIVGMRIPLLTVLFTARESTATMLSFRNNGGVDDAETLAYQSDQRFAIQTLDCNGFLAP